MAKSIKLMADYDCFPLWDMEDPGNIDPESLPLPEETKERLRKWAEHYDSTLNRDDPPSSGFASEEAEDAFEEEGRSLWEQLRSDLGPDYKVYFFSPLEFKLLE